MGADAGKVGLMKKSMYGTRDAASNCERDLARSRPRSGDFNWGPARRICFTTREDRVSGLTHGDDFVVTGPTEKLMEVERKDDECVSNQSEGHQLRVVKEHHNFEQEVALGRERHRVPT